MSEKRRALEAYYSTARVAVLLDYSAQWVRDAIKSGQFGERVIMVNNDYRVPASAINEFLERHRLRLPEKQP